ncbi:hypothetical protein AB1K09_20240 [Solibacillus silvestris]
MAKTKKFEPLVVGQRVWIELLGGWGIERERKVTEYEVVETNSSSAYAVRVKQLEAFREKGKNYPYSRTRIIQRTHAVANSILGYSEKLWLTEEDFERNVQYNKELKDLRSKAIDLVNKMTADELRKVLEI